MIQSTSTVRLIQHTLMAWVLLFTLFSWVGFGGTNVLLISPPWVPPGPLKYITHSLVLLPEGAGAVALLIAPWVLIALSAWELWQGGCWWRRVLVWWLFLNLMNAAWLAGSGGQQLMANMLLWSAFLAMRTERARFLGFWAIRLQLLLAYLATALHKLAGTHWVDGTGLGIAATDQAFGPDWIASFPTAARLVTWSVLLFQLTFPIAMWFRSLRIPWMIFGIAFHLGTAIWMDIPEMGFAFVACYAIWLDDEHASRIMRFGRREKSASTPG